MIHRIRSVKTDVLIVGAGPAGLTAAIYTGRAGVKTLILAGRHNSRLAISYTVENYPGFITIESRELLDMFRQHALKYGPEVISQDAIAFSLNSEPKFVTTKDTIIEAKTVILATGRPVPKEQLIPGEEKLLGNGVSYCATCDGPLFKGQMVAAIGYSEEALEEIEALNQTGCQVVWLPGKKVIIAEETLEKLKAKKVEVLADVRVKEISGGDRVEKVIVDADGRVEELKVSAVFIFRHVATGLIFSKTGLELDHRQCISVDRFQRTNIPGVFAAGDVTCGGLQIVSAAGEGCVAALQALAYLRQA